MKNLNQTFSKTRWRRKCGLLFSPCSCNLATPDNKTYSYKMRCEPIVNVSTIHKARFEDVRPASFFPSHSSVTVMSSFFLFVTERTSKKFDYSISSQSSCPPCSIQKMQTHANANAEWAWNEKHPEFAKYPGCQIRLRTRFLFATQKQIRNVFRWDFRSKSQHFHFTNRAFHGDPVEAVLPNNPGLARLLILHTEIPQRLELTGRVAYAALAQIPDH